jgi:Arc/MetJ-type ribon-helix-helix transcriptional regulator
MSATVRTTISLPVELLEAVDRAIEEGKARNRNDLLVTALRHELATQRRAEIDAAFTDMGADPEYLEDTRALEAMYAVAGWEALCQAEALP